MKLARKKIRFILADIYKNACLEENCDMCELAFILEDLARIYDKYPTIQAWSNIKIDKDRFDKEIYYKRILEFRSSIKEILLIEAIKSIKNQSITDKKLAYSQWLETYTEALRYWEDEVYETLCEYNFDFEAEDKLKVEEYKYLNYLISDIKWPEVYPYFLEFAETDKLPNSTRSYFYLYSAQIILYYFGYPALIDDLIKKSEIILPNNFLVNRVMAESLIISHNYEKARSLLLNAINSNPTHLENYLYLGDSYLGEQKFEAAEQWYNDAVQINFLDPLLYSKLIQLMGEEEYFNSRPGEIEKLLEKACLYLKSGNFGNTLYNLYMDAGIAFKKAKEHDKSIDYFKKAIQLKPNFASAKIDLAYVYVDKSDLTEAEKWLINAIHPTDFSLNFAAYWALGWLNEPDQLNNISKSIEYYQKCLGIRTIGDDRVFNMLGILYYNQDEYEKAAEYYKKAINEYKLEIVYHTNLKDALHKIGRNDLMIGYYDTLTACFPDNAEYLNEAGVFHYNYGNFERSLNYYDKAIELVQDNRIFWENRGLVYEKLYNYDLAISDYLKSIDIQENDVIYNSIGRLMYWQNYNDKASDYYTKAINLNPENAIYWENRAYAYEKQEKYNHAQRDITKALFIEKTAARFNLLGLIYYKLEKYESALENFSKAEKEEPTNNIYVENCASTYWNLGLIDDALEKYRLSLEIKEDDFPNNAIGMIHFGRGKYTEAIFHYSKAIELNADNPNYWENRALAYEKNGQYDQAEQDSRKALEILESPGRFNILGLSLYRQGRYEEAVQFYSNAIDLDDTNPIFWENRALGYEKAGKYELSEFDSRKALEIQETAGRFNILGLSLYMQDKCEEAVQNYSKAIALDPTNIVFWENRGLAKEALQMNNEASLDYEKALSLGSSPVSLNGLGKISYWKSDFESAHMYFSKALELEPNNDIYKDNLDLANDKRNLESMDQ